MMMVVQFLFAKAEESRLNSFNAMVLLLMYELYDIEIMSARAAVHSQAAIEGMQMHKILEAGVV